MSHENLILSSKYSKRLMLRGIPRSIEPSIQTGVFRADYDYALDGEGRIRFINVAPGGTRYELIY